MAGFFDSVFSPQNLYTGGQQLYDQMAGLTLNDLVKRVPNRAHGSRPGVSRIPRKQKKTLPVAPRRTADPSTFVLDAPQGWDVGIDTPESLARASAAAAGPSDFAARPQNHLATMLDALSNAQANRAMAQPSPQDASLFAEGGEQAMQQMGPNPRQLQDQFLHADPRNQPITTGQENIDQHLAARFPQGQGGAYQLLEEQAKRRRAVEQALTAEMDRAQLAGERRGYGSVPYAYMDNQVVDPRALQPQHAMNNPEAARLGQQIVDIQNAGGEISNAGTGRGPLPDQNVSISPGFTQGGTPLFRTAPGREYVEANREAISQMENGVDPTTVPRLTFQGQPPNADYAAREAARRAPILAHYRGLKKQREDTIAALARRRVEAAEARNMADAVGGFRQQGLTSRDALAAAMFGGIGGGEGGPQNQQAMDLAFPEVGQMAMRRKITDAQVAKDNAEVAILNDPEGDILRRAAYNSDPDSLATILEIIRQRRGQQGGAAVPPGAPAPNDPLNKLRSDSAMKSFVPQLINASSPNELADLIATQPQIANNPAQLARMYSQVAGKFPPAVIREALEKLGPNKPWLGLGGLYGSEKVRYEDQGAANWVARKLGTAGEETKAEHDARQNQIKILTEILKLSSGT